MSVSETGVPTQVAQAVTPVGEVAELTGDVVITRATGEQVQATVGTEVFQNDTFQTSADGGVGITFNDDSAFSLGSDARLIIDQFVYSPAGDSGMAMNLVQGAFSFVSGQIAKSGDNNMTIQTPTATIGVRGTAGAGDEDEAVLLPEPGQPLGEMTVTTQGGSVTLSTINAYTNTSNPLAPPTTPVFRPTEQIQSQFGNAIRELPSFSSSDEESRQQNGDEGGSNQQPGEAPATLNPSFGSEDEAVDEPIDPGDVLDDLDTPLEESGFDNENDDETEELIDDAGLVDGLIEFDELDLLDDNDDSGEEDPFGDPFEDDFDPGTVIEDGDEDPPVFETFLIDDANSSDPIFLSDGIIETFLIDVSSVANLSVNGNAIADSFVDVGNGSASIEVKLEDPGPHIVLLNNIDTLRFVPAQNDDGHVIGVGGTETLTIQGSGTLGAVISEDGGGTANTVRIGTGFSDANALVSLGGGTDTLEINTSSGSTILVDSVEIVTGSGGDDVVTNIGATGATFKLGVGADTATGASGVLDTFEFANAAEAGAGLGERITNFDIGTDRLDLSDFLSGNISFIGAAAFSGVGGQVRFDDGTETVQIDLNADTTADFEVTLDGVTAATFDAGDIVTASLGLD